MRRVSSFETSRTGSRHGGILRRMRPPTPCQGSPHPAPGDRIGCAHGGGGLRGSGPTASGSKDGPWRGSSWRVCQGPAGRHCSARGATGTPPGIAHMRLYAFWRGAYGQSRWPAGRVLYPTYASRKGAQLLIVERVRHTHKQNINRTET